MTSMSQLWLPILLSAVAVFLVSSAIHMLSPWHKGDYPRLANEDQVLDAMRPLAIPPGDYLMPRAGGMAEMKSPEYLAKLQRGPVLLMTVMPNGMMSMARSLGGWFVYLLFTNALAAHVAQWLPVGSSSALVFHEVALITFAGYVLALWQMTIWYRRSLSITLKSSVDGLIYALISGGVFAWLWPH